MDPTPPRIHRITQGKPCQMSLLSHVPLQLVLLIMHSYRNMAECRLPLEKKESILPLSTHTLSPVVQFAAHSLPNYHGSHHGSQGC